MTDFALPTLSRRRRAVNSITRWVVAVGGASVIGAIALLMGYLLYVVAPMFKPASAELVSEFSASTEDILHIATNDRFEVVTAFRSNGEIAFLNPETFDMTATQSVVEQPVVRVTPVFPTSDEFALQTSSDELYFVRVAHVVRFIDNQRSVESDVELLFDGVAVSLGENIDSLDVWRGHDKEQLRIATRSNLGTLTIVEYDDVDDFFELEEAHSIVIEDDPGTKPIYFGARGRWLFEFDLSSGSYELYDTFLVQRTRLKASGKIGAGATITALEPIIGRYSFLVADETGTVAQWSLQPSATGSALTPIREFEFPSPIRHLLSEQRRKGFLAIDADAVAHVAYTTSERALAEFDLKSFPDLIAIAPRADIVISASGPSVRVYEVDNPHPEISWSTLWSRIWYEGYEDPVFSWQSSSADTDFEPKFSLTPLLFGTLKAAIYAMLFAVPIAILGAVYTSHFMAPRMRAWVKPGIEIMAALPTVILGFLAGLWLAPIVEANLTSVLLCAIVLPIGMLVFAFIWSMLPTWLTVPFDGWYAAVAVPMLVLLAYVTLSFDFELSNLIFGGDARSWFYEHLGLDYDQRNALIIGLAMGLAVIPTIFSISEDALYGVPQHLVHGSLALGATHWQTLIRVVILTASPGIFSAVMIGFGRAVGETMIVLMATGNTPIMDFNLFQGMRTFAANIAVELPESEVASTHFRILFLTALVLFLITFTFNTVAEVVRHRLRARYGDL